MVFTEDDHVVEKLSANTADEALGYPILPRTPMCRPCIRDRACEKRERNR